MRDGARAAEASTSPRRAALENLLVRWTRFVPAIVWILWALHTMLVERQLADRKGAPVESLPLFLAQVAASYAALFVYGWLVTLILPRNRFLATAISAAFLAFYSLLSMSIELRGAPFVGWIHDLSAPDPYFVIPLLMGITMFWQQRISPTSADPTQQRVMMIMPIMFTAMMAFSPSGVVLYWTVSQLWAIGQQYLTNRLIGPPAMAPVKRGK